MLCAILNQKIILTFYQDRRKKSITVKLQFDGFAMVKVFSRLHCVLSIRLSASWYIVRIYIVSLTTAVLSVISKYLLLLFLFDFGLILSIF